MCSRLFFCLAIIACAINEIATDEESTSDMAKEAQTLLAKILRKGAVEHHKLADRVDNVIVASKDVASDGKSALWSSLKDVKESAGESVDATKDFVKSGFHVGKDYLDTAVQIFIVPAKTTNAVVRSILNKLSNPAPLELTPAEIGGKLTMPRIVYIDEKNIRHEYLDDTDLMRGLAEYLEKHAKGTLK